MMGKHLPVWVNRYMFWHMAWGAVIVLVLMAFSGEFVFKSTAEKMADEKASAAVVNVLTPMCAERFREAPEAASNLAAFKEKPSWDRGNFIADGNWAAFKGGEKVKDEVVSACANLLTRGLKQ